MNYLGIDYGKKRCGLSFGDELGVAIPLPAVLAEGAQAQVEAIAAVVKERRVDAIVVGYPYNMDGSCGFMAEAVDAFIKDLETRVCLPVHRIDERLSSHQAQADLAPISKSRKARKTPRSRIAERKTGELDSRAATLILQDFLEQQLR